MEASLTFAEFHKRLVKNGRRFEMLEEDCDAFINNHIVRLIKFPSGVVEFPKYYATYFGSTGLIIRHCYDNDKTTGKFILHLEFEGIWIHFYDCRCWASSKESFYDFRLLLTQKDYSKSFPDWLVFEIRADNRFARYRPTHDLKMVETRRWFQHIGGGQRAEVAQEDAERFQKILLKAAERFYLDNREMMRFPHYVAVTFPSLESTFYHMCGRKTREKFHKNMIHVTFGTEWLHVQGSVHGLQCWSSSDFRTIMAKIILLEEAFASEDAILYEGDVG